MNPNEPFVVVALTFTVYTSPATHLVTPVPAGTCMDSFCGFRRPSQSETEVVKDTKDSHEPAGGVSDYRAVATGTALCRPHCR
jgi:hypothetical protein